MSAVPRAAARPAPPPSSPGRPSVATPAREPFTISIAMEAERPRSYRFDRDRVLVGRGYEAQLAVRQRHLSRHQFEIRRLAARGGVGSDFFLLPYKAVTNPVVPEAAMTARKIRLRGESDQPVDCFQLEHGARFSVGPVHFTFARGSRAQRRTLLLGASVAAVTLFLALGPDIGPGSADTALDALAADVFATTVETGAAPGCDEPRMCATLARQFYQEGRRDLESVNVDRGMTYRAARAFERAATYRDGAGGAPLPELADLDAQLKVSRDQARDAVKRANARFQELRRRAMTSECIEAGEALEALLPDKDHPYRRKLGELRNSQTGFRGACGG